MASFDGRSLQKQPVELTKLPLHFANNDVKVFTTSRGESSEKSMFQQTIVVMDFFFRPGF